MAIRVRCDNCRALLSVARRKAGQLVRCPACRQEVAVPALDDEVSETVELEPLPPESAGEIRSRAAASGAGISTAALAHEHRVHELHTLAVDEEGGGVVMRKAETDFEEMDLTPMVDVTFLLLIFFMITAAFTVQKTLQFPPPDPDEEGAAIKQVPMEDLRQDSIIVEVDENNRIFIDEERDPVSNDADLADIFRNKRRGEDKSIVSLIVHRSAFHETSVRVIDAANEAGILKIRKASRE